MDLASILNGLGLIIITVSSIYAAIGSPAVQYDETGGISMGPQDQDERKKMHKRQKRLPYSLAMIGFGALLQFSALFLSDTAEGAELDLEVISQGVLVNG
ncbi:hypothetical protein [Shewanella algae]|uniref:hypothetical protein n=1 Tax=Shewanella algae TaxID=38313 RepID=UPI001AAE6343|nr:hypothetical protein [Shewanella algae]MBO2580275.1 hypothetical protein [Shewanella algae]